MDDIQVVDNFLSEEELQKAKSIIENTQWVYKNHSATPAKQNMEKDTIFWYAFLDKNPFFYEVIFNKIRNTFKKNFKITTIHTNGQTYGQDGDFHQDYLEENAYTCLIYFSDITEQNINNVGGYTLIKTQNGTVCIEPFLNRLLIFKSKLYHKGMAPLRGSNILRVSVAFRLLEC